MHQIVFKVHATVISKQCFQIHKLGKAYLKNSIFCRTKTVFNVNGKPKGREKDAFSNKNSVDKA